MAMNLAPVLRQRYLDANGNPLAGGKLYTYQAGTTTPQATYTDSSGGTPNANPVVLDANGEASVWLSDSLAYKFVLKDASDVTQWTQDNVNGAPSSANSGIATAKLADDSVTADKLRDDEANDSNRSVTTHHIRDSAVTTTKIADSNVTTAKIADSNVTTTKIADGAITPAKLAARATGATVAVGGVAASSSSGTFTTASSSPVDITNLSVTITTTGRPVLVALVPDGSTYVPSSPVTLLFIESPIVSGGVAAAARLMRGSTEVANFCHSASAGDGGAYSSSPSPLLTIDFVGAGTHTYKAQLACPGSPVSTLAGFKNGKLVAFEL